VALVNLGRPRGLGGRAFIAGPGPMRVGATGGGWELRDPRKAGRYLSGGKKKKKKKKKIRGDWGGVLHAACKWICASSGRLQWAVAEKGKNGAEEFGLLDILVEPTPAGAGKSGGGEVARCARKLLIYF